jgi:thiol-disulfide isomerase/thioredoxin
MNKKIFILSVSLILLVCIPLFLYSGQYRLGDFSKQKNVYASDFSLKDIQGKTFKLSSHSEMPLYKSLYNQYAHRGLKFLYININESTERVARYAKQNSFPYLVLLDSDGGVANDYSIIGVPTLILLDKGGKIISESHRTLDLPLDTIFSAKK